MGGFELPYLASSSAMRPAGEYPVDTSTPAVVLKFDPNVMHHGGLGVIRSLGRAGVPVYGVHEGPWAPAANSRYLAGRFFWQPSPADVDRVLTGLLRLAEQIGQPSVLLTTDDAGAIFLAEHGHDLRRWFLFPDPPRDLPRRLAGKYSLYEVCRELGVSSPRTVTPSSLDAAREFASAAGYPLIAKLTTPWANGSGLRSTSVVARPAGTGPRLRELRAIRRRADAAGVHPGRTGPRLVLPRVLRRQLDLPAGLYRRQGTVLPGRCRADQPRAFGGKRRPARRDYFAAQRSWDTEDFSISISALTSVTASTTCLISTRGSVRSSGFSVTPRAPMSHWPLTST